MGCTVRTAQQGRRTQAAFHQDAGKLGPGRTTRPHLWVAAFRGELLATRPLQKFYGEVPKHAPCDLSLRQMDPLPAARERTLS